MSNSNVIRIAPNNPVFDLPVIVGIEEDIFSDMGLDVSFAATYDDREKDSIDKPSLSRLKENLFEVGSADSYNVCEWASIDRLERGVSGGQIAVIVTDFAQGFACALVFLALGWLVYNELCKRISPTMQRDGVLGVAVALMMVAVAYLATHIFAGRAAFVLVGAVMATAMAANVYFWIIPGQRRMVAAMTRGQAPDPLDGKRGKQRSVHNTYFTLPVVLLMLSNHYAFLYTDPYAWVVIVLIFARPRCRERAC